MDIISYIGDILSFQLDYSANEAFLTNALEFDNVVRQARQIGFKLNKTPTSSGIATFFILIPSAPNGFGPDNRYIPVLKAGSTFSTINGNQFILNEDVRFDLENNETVVARVDSVSGLPTAYAIKSYGRVISGVFQEVLLEIGSFKRFLKLEIPFKNIAEVIKVEDSDGNEYFEVENLSQDIIYRPISNRTETKKDAAYILRPFAVPRRFVVEPDGNKTFIQFGSGQENSDLNKEKIVDPSAIVFKYFGKNYVSDRSFDPTNIIHSDQFGIVPINTTLRVVVRTNSSENVNANVDTLTKVNGADFDFVDLTSLDPNIVREIRNSLEISNEETIVGDISVFGTNEVRLRALNSFSAQNRAVSLQDYQALIYKMDPKYGAIKRVNVVRDNNSFKRNLNIYVISEDQNGRLIETNQTIKENLKMWLASNKMLNDTIDCLNARIINLGIDFTIMADLEGNKYDVLSQCIFNLKTYFKRTREIGEPLFLNEISDVIRKTAGVVDLTRLKINNKRSGVYSSVAFSIQENLSADGRYLNCPDNGIFEIRHPTVDVRR